MVQRTEKRLRVVSDGVTLEFVAFSPRIVLPRSYLTAL